jgi:ribosome maturation factor RimP
MTETAQDWLTKVEKIADDVCRSEGCYLYHIDFVGLGAGRTLRVFVDNEAGAGIDDCTKVSRALNVVLDADETLIPGGHYNLEVSTPGLDRILRLPWHFEKAVGKKIWIKTRSALESYGVTDTKWKNAKQVEEVLTSADAESITFEVKEGTIKVPISEIEKGKMVFEMKKPGQKPGHKK